MISHDSIVLGVTIQFFDHNNYGVDFAVEDPNPRLCYIFSPVGETVWDPNQLLKLRKN